MKQVTYHPEDGRSLVFDVLKVNPDKTVDIGLAAGGEDGKPLLVVGGCKVTDAAEIGACVAIASESDSKPLSAFSKQELVNKAELLGIDTSGMSKADLVAAIEEKEKEEA